MRPATGEYPPVRVLTIRSLEGLTNLRVRELRAKGIPYEVVPLDAEHAGDDG